MATTYWNEEDSPKSPNVVRQQRRLEERLDSAEKQAAKERKKKSEILKDAGKVADIAKQEITRNVMQEINKDDVVREAKKISRASSIALELMTGVACALAASASEAIYTAQILKAQGDSSKNYNKDETKLSDYYEERRLSKLNEYTEEVHRTAAEYREKRNAYYVEYYNTQKEAQQAINAAEKKYEETKRAVNSGMQQADKEYKSGIESYKREIESLQSLRKEYNEKSEDTKKTTIESANRRYEADVARIKSEFPNKREADREIKLAAERRDKTIANAEAEHNRFVDKSNTTINDKIKLIETEKDKIIQIHSQKTNSLNNMLVEADTNRKHVINHQNDIIHTSQIKHAEELQNAKKELSNAENKLRKFEESGVGTKEYAQRLAAMESGRINVNNGKETVSSVGRSFLAQTTMAHQEVGGILASKFGTKEEQALLNKIKQDTAIRREIENNKKVDPKGNPYISKTTGQPLKRIATQDDYVAARKIMSKYIGGDLKSEKQIHNSINLMKQAQKYIDSENQSIKQGLASDKLKHQEIEQKLNSATKKLENMSEITSMLKKSVGKDGKPLTADQRKELAAAVSKSQIKSLREDILNLKQQKNMLTGNIKSKTDKLNDNKHLSMMLTSHTAFLSKNGKAIANTYVKSSKNPLTGKRMPKGGMHSSKGEKYSKNGIRRIGRSIGKISENIQRSQQKGNAIEEERQGILKVTRKINQGYQRALTVSSFTGRVMMAPLGMSVKMMGHTLKVMGVQETALGKAFLKARSSKIVKRVGGTIRSGKNFVLKTPSRIIKGTQTLLNPEETVKALAGKAAGAVAQGGLHATGRVVGGTARLTGKAAMTVGKKAGGVAMKGTRTAARGIGNKVGQSAIGKAAKKVGSKVNNTIGKKVGKTVKKVAKTAATPFMWLGKTLIGAWRAIVGFFTGLFGLASSLVSLIVAAAGAGLLLLIVIILILCVLLSTLGALDNLLGDMSANSNSYVYKNPEFIMNQAVNYRNSEIEIFKLFSLPDESTNGGPSKDFIRINDSPIYYSLYDTTSFKFLWWESPGDKAMENNNTMAQSVYENVLFRLNNIGTVTSRELKEKDFKSRVDKDSDGNEKGYNSAVINYYSDTGDPNGPKKSEYEISNAKDALALVDAIYTTKTELMQKYEVLAYLGVGEYQTGKNDGANTVLNNNLFWATHKIEYLSGTKPEDIWFHATDQASGRLKTNTIYTCISGDQYGQQSIGSNDKRYGVCDNFEKHEIVYEVETNEQIHTSWTDARICGHDFWAGPGTFTTGSGHGYLNGTELVQYYGYSAIGSRKVNSSAFVNIFNNANVVSFYKYSGSKYHVFMGAKYYGLVSVSSWSNSSIYNAVTNGGRENTGIKYFQLIRNGSYYYFNYGSPRKQSYYYEYPSVDPSCIVSYCEHYKTEEKTFDFYICKGHIDLDVKMTVSHIDQDNEEYDKFFEQATTIEGKPEGDELGWLFNFDGVANGIGSVVIDPYDPSTDWNDTSELRGLAMVKTQTTEVAYNVPVDGTLRDIALEIKASTYQRKGIGLGAKTEKFSSIAQNEDNDLLFGVNLYIQPKPYYMLSYISGEQKNMECYDAGASGIAKKLPGYYSNVLTKEGTKLIAHGNKRP